MNIPLVEFGLRLLSGVVFMFLAYRLNKREVESQEDRRAWQAYVVWWAALGIQTLLARLTFLLAISGITALIVHVVITLANLLLLCIALWGLLYYLVYVYQGKPRFYRPMQVFYAIYFLTLMVFILYQRPVGVIVEEYAASLDYARETGGIVVLILLILLIVPQIIAGLFYFLLYFRIEERYLRYRIMLVSWSIILWFGVSLVGALLGFSQLSYWPVISQLIGLSAAVFTYLAYYPTNWIQSRLRLYEPAHPS